MASVALDRDGDGAAVAQGHNRATERRAASASADLHAYLAMDAVIGAGLAIDEMLSARRTLFERSLALFGCEAGGAGRRRIIRRGGGGEGGGRYCRLGKTWRREQCQKRYDRPGHASRD